jgi:Tfp pilus assembly protein PilF
MAGSAAFAILYMSLKLPFYSQSKCFYGLPALPPLCVFGVLGLDYWNRRGRGIRAVLSVALLLWVCNVYCSFWIRPSSPRSEFYTATAEYSTGSDDESARRKVELALRAEPRNEGVLILAAALMERKEGGKAASEFLRKALALDPRSGDILRFLGWYALKAGETNEALSLTERAVALEPESLQAADQACVLAAKLGDNQKALEMGRAALGIDPSDPELHLEVARDWMALGYREDAVRQLVMLLSLKPPPPIEKQARSQLARLLAKGNSPPGS